MGSPKPNYTDILTEWAYSGKRTKSSYAYYVDTNPCREIPADNNKKELDMALGNAPSYALIDIRSPKTGETILKIDSKFEVVVGGELKDDKTIAEVADGLAQFMTLTDSEKVRSRAALVHCLAAMKTMEKYAIPSMSEDDRNLWNKATDLAQECFNAKD